MRVTKNIAVGVLFGSLICTVLPSFGEENANEKAENAVNEERGCGVVTRKRQSKSSPTLPDTETKLQSTTTESAEARSCENETEASDTKACPVNPEVIDQIPGRKERKQKHSPGLPENERGK